MEPERRIEKLLRAFAKKRREQAGDPIELHPVARQQLQKEIARRAAGTSSGGGWFSSFFLGLRPRLAFALCFIALAVAGLILLPNLTARKPSTLASATLSRQEKVPAEKTKPAPTPPPVVTVAPPADEEARASRDKGQVVSGSVAMKPMPPAAVNPRSFAPSAETLKQDAVLEYSIAKTQVPAGVAAASPAPSNKEMFAFEDKRAAAADSFGGANVANTRAFRKDETVQQLPPVPPPPGTIGVTTNGTILAANGDAQKKLNIQRQAVSPPPTSTVFFDRSKAETAAAIPPASQIFNRTDVLTPRRRATDPLSGSSPVLVSFRVEQTGNAMRVVDADGSVYTGAVQVAQQAGAASTAVPKNAPTGDSVALIAAPSQAAQNYSFRVAGTNRNLKQNVIFSGNLIPLTNAPLPMNAFAGGATGGRRTLVLPVESLLSNSRISGKAIIGDQKEIEVNATPAP